MPDPSELAHQSYRVSASLTPGTLIEDERMEVGHLVGFLRGLADGLEARRVEPPKLALIISPVEPDDG